MAKKEEKTVAAIPIEPARPKRSGLILGIVLLAVSISLLLALLHITGVLQPVYKRMVNTPGFGPIARALASDEVDETLTPEQLVDRKFNIAKMKKSVREAISEQTGKKELDNVNKKIETLNNSLKEIKDRLDGLETAAVSPGGQPAAQPGALPAARAPSAATAATAPAKSTGLNYRSVAKTFEKAPAETVVDILNNLSEDDQVGILSAMKEKNKADILAAYGDPKKTAAITERLLGRAPKTGGAPK